LGETPALAYSLMRSDDVAHAGDSHGLISIIATVVAVAGIGLAALLYLAGDALVRRLKRLLAPLYLLSHGKLFFDPIYYALVVWPLLMLARLSYWIDRRLIDGLVNFVGRVPPAVAGGLRPLGSGLVQFYALAMVWGVLVLVATLLIWPALAAALK
jgi:NADH:ubiquinone oxidoreductase subunit 5 (subunit L)/multisubunit Na+/H+ antiporter MnhA subunit